MTFIENLKRQVSNYENKPLTDLAKALYVDIKFLRIAIQKKNIQHKCIDNKNFYKKNRVEQRKIEALNYKGGMRCMACGIDEPILGLYTLHHRDPSEKEFTWAQIRNKTLEEIKPELDKCDVLCPNCHVKVHFYERQKASGRLPNKPRKKR